MKEGRVLWKFKLKENSELNFKFEKDFAVIALKNNVYWFNTKGLLWKKKFSTTFYRDPYSDVKITALDVRNKYTAIGTNFMDGKLYLFKGEKKLWEHQFATIASLGWRPEDVAAITIGNDFVATVTQFMHTYLYVYDFNRKRLANERLEGDVTAIDADESLAVCTENFLYILKLNQKSKPVKFDFKASSVTVCGDIVFASNKKKTVKINEKLKTIDEGGKLKHFGNYLFILHEDTLKILDIKELQKTEQKFEEEIKDVFYDEYCNVLYVLTENKCWVSELKQQTKNLVWDVYNMKGGVGIGKIGVLCLKNEELSLVKV